MYGHPITPPKPRRKSKTYIANTLIALLLGVEAQLHVLQPILPVNVFVIAAFALPLINLLLREFTNCGVGKVRPIPSSGSDEEEHF